MGLDLQYLTVTDSGLYEVERDRSKGYSVQ